MLQAAIDKSQEFVSGTVRLKLYKGNVIVIGRSSPNSLYSQDLVTFEDDQGAYDQKTPKASSNSTPCACARSPCGRGSWGSDFLPPRLRGGRKMRCIFRVGEAPVMCTAPTRNSFAALNNFDLPQTGEVKVPIMSENEPQREFWNGPVAENWVARAAHFERGFSELTAALMDFAAPASGMRVLDIGCGAGFTTAKLAAAVAPGKVVGLDISEVFIAAAHELMATWRILSRRMPRPIPSSPNLISSSHALV